MRVVIGIDPGLSGAVGVLDAKTRQIVDVKDMPVIELKKKKHIDVFSLSTFIDAYSKQTEFSVVEEVGAAPKQGVSSTFKFGYVTGVAVGILAANYITVNQIRPSVWKPALGLSRDKDASRALAIKLWPKSAHLFARKKDDGRAEALLLAWFGLRYS